jgi:hypothetical protein
MKIEEATAKAAIVTSAVAWERKSRSSMGGD